MSLYYTNRAKWDKLPLHKRLQEIKDILNDDIARWNHIKKNGCSDPFWPDGVNMNLTRNHIIYNLRILYELEKMPIQISLFTNAVPSDIMSIADDPRVPPLVSNDYMAKERLCHYFEGR